MRVTCAKEWVKEGNIASSSLVLVCMLSSFGNGLSFFLSVNKRKAFYFWDIGLSVKFVLLDLMLLGIAVINFIAAQNTVGSQTT